MIVSMPSSGDMGVINAVMVHSQYYRIVIFQNGRDRWVGNLVCMNRIMKAFNLGSNAALAQPFSFSTAFHSRRSEKITKSLMLSCRFAAYLRIFAACSTVQRK